MGNDVGWLFVGLCVVSWVLFAALVIVAAVIISSRISRR